MLKDQIKTLQERCAKIQAQHEKEKKEFPKKDPMRQVSFSPVISGTQKTYKKDYYKEELDKGCDPVNNDFDRRSRRVKNLQGIINRTYYAEADNTMFE